MTPAVKTAVEAAERTEVTKLPEGVYWVVYVTEILAHEGVVTRYDKRFEFRGEGASMAAWECYQGARRYNFQARAEKVRSNR